MNIYGSDSYNHMISAEDFAFVQLVLQSVLDWIFRLILYLPFIFIVFFLFLLYLKSHSIYIFMKRSDEMVAEYESKSGKRHHEILIIVPTFNEARTIRKKIENLLSLNYPSESYAIAIVDGASTDDTVKIVNDFKSERQQEEPKIFVIRQDSRSGKSDGIIFCLESVQFGDIILVTDANCYLNPDSLDKAEKQFWDSRVGGVTVSMDVPVRSNNWVSKSERFYWKSMIRDRTRESRKGLFFHFSGEFQMMRRQLAESAFKAARFTFSEDMIGGLVTILDGYKVVYLSNTNVTETGISTLSDLIKQKRNRAIGLFDAANFFYKSRNPNKRQYRISTYLKTIVPLFSPLVFIGLLVTLMLSLPPDLFIGLLLFGMVSIALVPQVRFFVAVQIAILSAIGTLGFGKRARYWAKTESNRDWPEIQESETK